jgi:hypothetical protein
MSSTDKEDKDSEEEESISVTEQTVKDLGENFLNKVC